jgi:hypothetical protein
MARKPREIEEALRNKYGFVLAKTRGKDHRCYVLRLQGLPPIHTKVSHSKRDIGPALEAKIARQMRVEKSFFELMLACKKSTKEYQDQVRDDPHPPFDVIL